MSESPTEPGAAERELSADEERAIRGRVAAVWGYDAAAYWYPLSPAPRPDLLALQAPYFRRALARGPLQGILRSHGVGRVWELREDGPSAELAVGTLDPAYTGAEGFWCSGAMDWALYASHESSITLGGAWLIAAVQRAWPDWARRVWTTPFF